MELYEEYREPYEIISRFTEIRHWTWTERIRGNQRALRQETFIPEIIRRQTELCEHFQSPTPHSGEFLLHHKEAASSARKRPLLLVHGASHDANLSWCKSTGKCRSALQVFCSERDVFAVTFAHPHGDNLLQAIQLSNAVKRILDLTGASKLDLVAHSKGGIVARTYLSGLVEAEGAPYQEEVNRCFLLGSPNGGLDFPFRHLSPNWLAAHVGISAPLAWDSMLYYGCYVNTTRRSIYKDGGAFPGLLQILARWDERYPILPCARTLYEGGQGWWFHSRGIGKAMEEGDQFMRLLSSHPIHEEIDLYLLAGSKPFINGICTEWDAPSDGLVFVDSALQTDGLCTDEKQMKKKNVLCLNHLELLYHPMAHRWIMEGLEIETEERSFAACLPSTFYS